MFVKEFLLLSLLNLAFSGNVRVYHYAPEQKSSAEWSQMITQVVAVEIKNTLARCSTLCLEDPYSCDVFVIDQNVCYLGQVQGGFSVLPDPGTPPRKVYFQKGTRKNYQILRIS